MEEMQQYLRAVFSVIQETSPAVFAEHSVTAQELASVTAHRCFAEVDLNQDQRLSFDEFRAWYSKPAGQAVANMGAGAGAAAMGGDADAFPGLEALRRKTGLGAVDATDVVSLLEDGSAADSMLDRVRFHTLMLNAIAAYGEPEASPEELAGLLDMLFDLFDTDGNGRVDAVEMASGLSMLCAGSRDDKVKAAFRLYDTNGDGYISRDEMATYLTAVFRVLYKTSQETGAAMGVSAEELGGITADQCFAEADTDQDGRLSLEEFREWYSRPSAAMSQAAAQVPAAVGLAEARRLTNLQAHPLDDVLEAFAEQTDDQGLLSREAFMRAFQRFLPPLQPGVERGRAGLVLSRLFDVFDADDNGFVDFAELASGLTVLCGGSTERKVRSAFALYDFNGDGYISREEMTMYLTSVFKVLFTTQPGAQEQAGMPAEELAAVTAERCFNNADLNEDGRLSFQEFQAWYAANADTRNGSVVIDATQLPVSLPYARQVTGLETVDAQQLVTAFQQRQNSSQALDRTAFEDVMRAIIPASHASSPQAHLVISRLFDVFDTDGNGFVDLAEMCAGLTMLCGGDADNKVEAAFALFDFDQDGYVTLEEMTLYLASMFRLVYWSDPAQRQRLKVSPEELALATARECFKHADTNHDGKLSAEEFKAWYAASSAANGEDLGGELSANLVSLANVPLKVGVEEVQRVSGLGALPAMTVLEVFGSHADPARNTLSHSAFNAALRQLADAGNPTGGPASRAILSRLFYMFDTDGDGEVDYSELMAGLSVLTGDSQESKIAAAFKVFDLDGDGAITFSEMVTYLTSVFKVLYETHPGVSERMGVGPQALAEATARQCFAEADANEDGVLTLQEFQAWHARAEERGGMLQQQVLRSSSLPVWNDLDEVRRVTSLGTRNVEDVMEVFASGANNDGVLTRESFNACFRRFATQQSSEDAAFCRVVQARLFDMFDTNGDGFVDFAELASGLSVLCGGDRERKMEAAFALYDFNGDGYISLEEMVLYLTSVFKVLYEAQPSLAEQLAVTAEELAAVTAQQCFSSADLDKDGRLSLEEFKQFFASRGDSAGGVSAFFNDPASSPDSAQGVAPAASHKGSGGATNGASASWLSLEEVKRLTNFGSASVDDVLEAFAECSDDDGALSRGAFEQAARRYIRTGSQTPIESQRTELVLARLFDLFDTNGDGRVDFAELASGLSVLCGGSRDDKVKAAFQLFDFNGDGFISKDEMELYLTAVFKVLYEAQPGVEEHIGVGPEALAVVTAKQCFADADLNEDGRLSLEEFQKWYSTSMGGMVTDGAPSTPGSVVDAVANTTSWLSLEEAKRLTNLQGANVADVMEAFAVYADDGGVLSKSAFNAGFRQFVGEQTQRDALRTRLLLSLLFNAFDKDGNGVVDFAELASGLSVLCGGDREAKVEAAFALFDFNGDGYISMEEMVLYLTSVFKVLYATQPGVEESMGVSADVVAEVTAAECFAEADLDEDGRLSLDEFKKYAAGSEGSPFVRGAVLSAGDAAARLAEAQDDSHGHSHSHGHGHGHGHAGDGAEPTVDLDLETVRKLTRLDQHSVHDVLEVCAAHADEQGTLDAAAFDQAFAELVGPVSSEEEAELVTVIYGVLFSLFDTNGDGRVDFAELCSGVSVLCGDDRDAKVDAAFALFDDNDDGYIGMDEMVTYLTSVFKVLYEVRTGLAERMGVPPSELARVTAAQCFADADVNTDGRISREEFKAWYSRRPVDGNVDAVATAVVDQASAVGLAQVRDITGLGDKNVSEVCNAFAVHTDSVGQLDWRGFNAAFMDIAGASAQSDDGVQAIIRRLFNMFDANGDGRVDFAELASGLSILCGGDRDAKVEAAFQLYDVNGDGYISLEEMELYLASVFRVMYAADPAVEARMGVSAEDLASATAAQCFRDADIIDRDGRLSLAEFKLWYGTQAGTALGRSVVHAPQVPAAVAAAAADQGTGATWTRERLGRVTCLGDKDVMDALEVFAGEADGNGELDEEAFLTAFSVLLEASGVQEGPYDDPARRDVLRRLFALFDTDGSGRVDFPELASGLSMLCAGTLSSKADIAFALYDHDRDGYISRDEMERHLTAVFKVLLQTRDAARTEGMTAASLAAATTGQCFEECDTNGDNRISLDEFRRWYQNLDGNTSGATRAAVADSADVALTLDDVRRVAGLGSAQVVDVVSVFASYMSGDTISRRNFAQAMEALAGPTNTQLRDAIDLYGMFDANNDGVVDARELVTGLSVLCGGGLNPKVDAAFALYDADGDGYVSFSEMETYLTSVFRMLYAAQSDLEAKIGKSAQELATDATRECFELADTNDDGRLSREEFKQYFRERSDTPIGRLLVEMTSGMAGAGAGAGAALDLEDVKRYTSLGVHPVSKVLDLFAMYADGEGLVSRAAFDAAYEHLVTTTHPAPTPRDAALGQTLASRLFECLDDNRNGGALDFAVLASGLSVLCGGTPADRVRAAFYLFDVAGEGYIAQDEMELYLRSVFRVLRALVTTAAGGDSMPPDELARFTASGCFTTAAEQGRLDDQGRLSFADFRALALPGSAGHGAASEGAASPESVGALLAATVAGQPVVEVLDAFASVADGQGLLSLQAFVGAFASLLPTGQTPPRGHANASVELFNAFDRNGDGLVDFAELGAGLAVVCGEGRSPATRAECVDAAFALFDVNGDGVLSLDEMGLFVASLLRVQFARSPTARQRLGVPASVSADEAGSELTKACFAAADANHDDVVSKDEFKRWFATTPVLGQAAPAAGRGTAAVDRNRARVSASLGHGDGLAAIKEATTLGTRRAADVMALFASFANEDRELDRAAFNAAFRALLGDQPPDALARSSLLTSRLFTLFDGDANGVVDLSELSGGLSVLCRDDMHEKMRASFDVFDVDGDGYISLDEMTAYLTSVYKVMYDAHPQELGQSLQAPPEHLAAVTARECFRQADTDRDGRLSFDEFRGWFEQQSQPIDASPPAPQPSAPPAPPAAAASPLSSLDEVRRLTHLGQAATADVVQVFKHHATNGILDRQQFERAFRHFIGPQSAADSQRTHALLGQLYDRFDTDGNGVVDVLELASGLSVLTRGTPEERFNGDGFISEEEMVTYLSSVFRVLYNSDPSAESRLGVSPDDLAVATARQCFAEADTNSDGRLSLQEFKAYFTSPQAAAGAAANADAGARAAANAGGDAGAGTSVNLSAVRAALPVLQQYDAATLASAFARFADTDARDGSQTLSRRAFNSCLNWLLPGQSHDEATTSRLMLSRVFDMFDRNHDGVADYAELVAGLTILVGGDHQHNKVRAAFDMFDRDHNGYIDLSEMATYLAAVFTVLFDIEHGLAQRVGMSPEQFGLMAAREAFQENDVNHDGLLSFDEFKAWYSGSDFAHSVADAGVNALHPPPAPSAPPPPPPAQPRGNTGPAPPVPPPTHGHGHGHGHGHDHGQHHLSSQHRAEMTHAAAPFLAAQAPSWTSKKKSLAALRKVTGLEQYSVVDVMNVLERHTTLGGFLSRAGFEAAFNELGVITAGRVNRRAQQHAIRRVFNTFDTDGSGTVTASDVFAGISMLCGGTRDERVAAAFRLYDADGDGYIDQNEMHSYLTAVFRALADTEDGVHLSNTSPDVVALEATRQCFAEADTNHDGRLSFEEFARWYSSDLDSASAPVNAPAATSAPSLHDAVQQLTVLNEEAPHDVQFAFLMAGDEHGNLRRDAFNRVMQRFLRPTSSHADHAAATALTARLFDLFDNNGNGVVDPTELAAGVAMLCRGTREQQLESAFNAFHDGMGNGDGIPLPALQLCLLAVLRVHAAGRLTGDQLDTLSMEKAEQCFEAARVPLDGRLTLADFKRWFSATGAGDDDLLLKQSVAALPQAHAPEWDNLSAIRKLTTLGDHHVEEALDAFRRHADTPRGLTRAAFGRAFSEFMRRTARQPAGGSGGPPSVQQLHTAIDRLFSLFDTNSDGVVDYHELASGLTVLCGGSGDDKVTAAFKLYDRDGDGYITLEEMTSYLAIVFRVLYEMPDTRSAMQLDPDRLARATATACFAEADTDPHDGKLSLSEFKRWYRMSGAGGADSSQPSRLQATVVDAASPSAPWHTVAEMKRLTNLGAHDVDVVLEAFAEFADDDGMLDRASFDRAFAHFMAPLPSAAEARRATLVVGRLWRLFDTHGNGKVDFSEVASGLSVLCHGSKETKVEAAFALYDYSGDGYIDTNEMETYLTAVFKVLYASHHGRDRASGMSAEDLARATTRQCFAEADANHDGRLSFTEFREWYLRSQPHLAAGTVPAAGTGASPEPSAGGANASPAAAVVQVAAAPPAEVSLDMVRELTQLHRRSVDEIVEAFGDAAEDNRLTRAAFLRVFRRWVDPADPAHARRLGVVLNRLFDLFDTDHNGFVDFSELAAGLTVLCGGSQRAKVESAFALYDNDGDGYITMDEMVAYLTAVFTVAYETDPSMRATMARAPRPLAEVTAEQCFAEADTDNDGRLSFAEFQAWYTGEDGDASLKDAVVDVGNQPPAWFSMAEVRRLTTLSEYPADEVMAAFALFADQDGEMDEQSFQEAFVSFTPRRRDALLQRRLNVMLHHLFREFDTNRDGKVDFAELASGLSVLCGGQGRHKVKAAFDLYDVNGDGYITDNEMVTYLTSVYRVLFTLSPDVRASMAMGPEDLARKTTEQCFAEADANHDGRLSYEEFQAWYSRSGDGHGASDVAEMVVATAPKWGSLQEVRHLTALQRVDIQDVVDAFAGAADSDGSIDRATFDKGFGALIHRGASLATPAAGASPLTHARSSALLRELFALFDQNGDGRISLNELVAGLTILVGGDHTDRVRAAFDLYDADGDGYISPEEMETYLLAVYRVMYAKEPSTEEVVGVPAEELARVTTQQCFMQADTDRDGKISFSEFQAWFRMHPDDLPSASAAATSSTAASATQATTGAALAATDVQAVLRLDQYTTREVFATFREQSRDGRLSHSAFRRALLLLASLGGGLETAEAASRVTALVDRLFSLFDTNEDGSVDFSELASGLTVFCYGDARDKVEAAFRLFDLNGDGYIGLDEMVTYLRAVFRVMYQLQPGTQGMTGVPAEELARVTAAQAFAEADTTHNGRLSFEEFSAWYTNASG